MNRRYPSVCHHFNELGGPVLASMRAEDGPERRIEKDAPLQAGATIRFRDFALEAMFLRSLVG